MNTAQFIQGHNKQEMLHILTIPVRKIIISRIRNLKQISNIDVQQDYHSKKSKSCLLVEVSLIIFFLKKTS